MDQSEFTGIFCARPQNFAWFLGAGTSRTAGLPSASDIIWDLKRRYYCREENQEILRQDIQNAAVRSRIQDFALSKGFPDLWADGEYPAYFDKIFGDDRERQRRYLKSFLSEEKVTLSVGCRVFGAFLASGLSRAAFTTNFDSVVEKATAEVSGLSLSAYHLEGSSSANQALNNEEYPLYCKLHGDFRYESLKNLPADLATQNEALSECFINAANRFGFVVAGFSGRDASVMALFREALESNNPFPHGLFWTGIKGSPVHPSVEILINQAKERGVMAAYVAIETYDAMMLRLWRNIDSKQPDLDAKVRRTQPATVHIPLPAIGRRSPIMRLNALPVISTPLKCVKLSFSEPKQWADLRDAQMKSEEKLILTKADAVLCWSNQQSITRAFGDDLVSSEPYELPADISLPENRHVKGFIEEALSVALARGRPLLSRSTRYSTYLIADPHADDRSELQPLSEIVGATSGDVRGLFTSVTDEHPSADQVSWSESVRIALDVKDDKLWLLLNPDIWIWPLSARRNAAEFMDGRRRDRYNKKYGALLDAWVRIILGTNERNALVRVSAFSGGTDVENPTFEMASRTAFARKLSR